MNKNRKLFSILAVFLLLLLAGAVFGCARKTDKTAENNPSGNRETVTESTNSGSESGKDTTENSSAEDKKEEVDEADETDGPDENTERSASSEETASGETTLGGAHSGGSMEADYSADSAESKALDALIGSLAATGSETGTEGETGTGTESNPAGEEGAATETDLAAGENGTTEETTDGKKNISGEEGSGKAEQETGENPETGSDNPVEAADTNTGNENAVTPITDGKDKTDQGTVLSSIETREASGKTSGVEKIDGESVFVNRLDGYMISLDSLKKTFGEDFTPVTSRMEVGAEFEAPDISVQVVLQDLSGADAVSAETYIRYSKLFLNNTIDHTLLAWETENYKGHTLTTVKWKRDLLSRVENDKNYYTCMDLEVGDIVYTFLLKAKNPYINGKAVLDAFAFTEKTETPADRMMRITKADTKMNSATKKLYKSMFLAEDVFTWGFFFSTVPYDTADADEFASACGTDIDFYMEYIGFTDKSLEIRLGDQMKQLAKDGTTFMITLQTDATEDGSNPLYDVLNGEYDAFLEKFAKEIRNVGVPVLLRIGNEMNGDWCSYSGYNASMDSSLFRAFYSYIKSFVDKAGAENVIWVWNPNEKSYPDFRWNDMMAYFPEEGADVYGITGYNTGTFYTGETWRSFSEIYDPLIQDADIRSDIPYMITEFSCAEVGGDKAAWITDMFETIGTYKNLKAAVWWNGYDKVPGTDTIAREYRVDQSETYIQLFRKYMRK